MPLRKVLLRLMLASLAVSAVGGILAVLTAGQEVVWRVVGTGMLAAVGSGLLLILSLLIDKEKTQPAALLGMTGVVIAFILSLVLIWHFPFTSSDAMVGLTLLLVLGSTPPLMFFLRVMYADRGKWAGIVGLTGCGIAVVLCLVSIWINGTPLRSWSATANLAASAWAVSTLGAIIAGNLVGVGTDRRWWRWIGIITSVAACVMAQIGIWAHIESGGLAFAIITGIAVVVAHANLAFLCNLRSGQQWVRLGTVGAVIVTSMLVDVQVGLDDPSYADVTTRGIAAAAIAAGCGTLALLVLALLNRKITTRTIPANVKELAIICPWCQRKQMVPLGASSCAGCRLKFQIAVEEPHCPNCDYLLYMLTSDRCPECGTVVRAQTEATPATAN